PAVCAAALILVVVPPLFTGEWMLWLKRALIFLVVSCPCALVISIPLSFFAGLGAASSSGILVKGGNFLEALAKVDTMVFDKTGTLSKGVFTVQAVHSEVMDEAQLLEIAALAESFSNHPIAVSIADEYRARSGQRPDKARVEDAKEYAGEGIVSIVDGREVACGNEKLMMRVGSDSEDCYLSGTQVHVAVDGEYRGHIIISDVIKEDAADAVKTLKSIGVKRIVMLTGDREAAARAAAEQTGVDEYHSELSPESKLAKLEELITSGANVAFAGDGINDAPVIAAADVGIAMGDMGSQSAVEAADIVLMNDRPSDIALAVKISRKTMRIVYQNIVMSIGVKLAVMALAALGMANMWMAIFGDVGVCIIAIFNSMRALKIKT
ncbi:MAG: heavy metal translocating P-type ATPase, partial [Clostridiales bacterium]|nr:heavy metal translocating P-type ATPase [Clostridiales bacterium]